MNNNTIDTVDTIKRRVSSVINISKDNDILTLINVFDVKPENQEKLIQLLEEATEKIRRYLPGFISANIHKSLNGTKVVNYAQWTDMKVFQAMLEDAQAKIHMNKIYELSSPDPHLYEVLSVYHA